MALKTKIIVQQILNIDDTTTTASKYPKYTVVLGTSISSITAGQLTAAVEASAASAAAAKDSENAAKTSEINAKTSETNAKTSETNALTSKNAAAASQTDAATSATNAKTSETNAKTSETSAKASEIAALASKNAAKTSETNAKTSETNAKTSETNALASKNAAAASQTAAKTSETNAEVSETNAKASELAAATSATNAATSETNTLASKNAAATSQIAAKTSETNAKTSETSAKTSETNAKTSETNAKTSETNAKTSETNAAAYAAAAKTSETNAADSAASASDSKGFRDEAEAFAAQASTSALAAKNSETNTKTSEINSKASEDAAKLAQQGASGSANTATQAMTTTKGYRDEAEGFKNTATTAATTAADKALEAAGSATMAGEKAIAATNAADRAEIAAASAEQVTQASLKKDQNLKDLTDKVAARKELQIQAVVSKDSNNVGDYNSFTSPNVSYELRLANDGGWRVARNSDNATSALPIGAGGTGAENVDQARVNLQVNRVVQTDTFTLLCAPDNTRLVVANNNEVGFQNASGFNIALPISSGGTGATNAAGARANIELGEVNTPSFATVAASLYNGFNSGLFYMRNHDASRNLISYSSIYNELQSSVAKTTLRTTNSTADKTAFYQFDENGQFSAQKIKIGANYSFTMEGGEQNNLQLYAGASVPLDDWANFTRYNWYNDLSLSGAVRSGSDKIKCHRIRVYSPGIDSQDYDFFPQGNLRTRAFNAGTTGGHYGWGIEQQDSGNAIPFNSVSTTNNNASFSPVIAGGTSTPNGYNIRFAIGMLSPGASGWSRTILKLLGDTDKHRGFEFNVDGGLGTWANAPGDMWGVSYDFAKNPTSDRDLKKEIVYTDGKESYDRVMQWLPTMFKYKWGNTQRYGLIAQDLSKIDLQYVKLVSGAPIFEDVIGVDAEGNEYVHHQIETDRADDTLAIDSNVVLADMACAMVYMGNQLEQQRKELDELKKLVSELITPDNS
ncbi:tail fiber protein [Salmonella phage S133]|uniref:L-shaped fiber n=2 Tax=Epseptimavirus TaxID=2732017 RepID=A0A2Z5HNM4_9CAUD|nr:tail fiber protein [Salmonella phage S114]YP_009805748.1 tail fiber protein [Salmonella phage S133]AXC40207.1 L-shaped fiber [Salmonella phage S114]AXC41939.1 L-shaped fiber [Salmonella phage S133]